MGVLKLKYYHIERGGGLEIRAKGGAAVSRCYDQWSCPTSPSEAILRHILHKERDAYGPGQLQPTPSEGSLHYDTVSSLHLLKDPFTINDDHGQDRAVRAWAPPPLPQGPQDLPGTTGRMEQLAG
jgi:hypothetical protein